MEKGVIFTEHLLCHEIFKYILLLVLRLTENRYQLGYLQAEKLSESTKLKPVLCDYFIHPYFLLQVVSFGGGIV